MYERTAVKEILLSNEKCVSGAFDFQEGKVAICVFREPRSKDSVVSTSHKCFDAPQRQKLRSSFLMINASDQTLTFDA